MSLAFPDLDAELMSTQVYQRAVRSLFRSVISRRKASESGSTKSSSSTKGRILEEKQQKLKSKSIDDMLRRDRKAMRSNVAFAVFGQYDSTMDMFFTSFSPYADRIPDQEELLSYRSQIIHAILERVRKLIDITMGQAEVEEIIVHQQALKSKDLKPDLASNIMELWRILSTSYDRAELMSYIQPFPL